MAIIEETAITVDARIGALYKNLLYSRQVEVLDEGGTRCVLNAMDWPKHLRQSVELDDLAWFLAGMISGEAAVVGRMPILSGYDKIEVRLQPIDEWHDFMAVGH